MDGPHVLRIRLECEVTCSWCQVIAYLDLDVLGQDSLVTVPSDGPHVLRIRLECD